MYDVIVVGARCAGSPLAMLLARKGYRVLLVDRARFPSDILSTHYTHQPGAAYLKNWGLPDRVFATNCPPIPGMHFDVGPFAIEGTAVPCGDVSVAVCPRRKILDRVLFEAAAEAGVEVRDQCYFRDVVRNGDRINGISLETALGNASTEHGRVVVGADGQHSIVARSVNAGEYSSAPAYSCNYYTYFSGVPAEKAELYNRERCLIGLFPTNDNLVLVFVAYPIEEFRSNRGRHEEKFFQLLKQVPHLLERVSSGRREERFSGTTDLHGFFRKSHGPGWVLAGDAGYHKHPITAQGITDAFRDADNLAIALDAGLSGAVNLDYVLAEYARTRDEAVAEMYQMTCELAKIEPPTLEKQQLFGAIRGNQSAIDQFLGTIAGTVRISEFFAAQERRSSGVT
jgi:2-polyprenyl-6-methoxyphenol hydroxylase-like FAD-dependent oxidoreductase